MSKYGKTIPYSDDYHSVHVWAQQEISKASAVRVLWRAVWTHE